jgi:Ca-activated chloride channel family protein
LSLILVGVMLGGWASATKPEATVSRQDEIFILPNRVFAPPPIRTQIDMTRYNIDVSVQNQLATTTVEQTFVNRSNRTLEAKYLYPLPEGANFSSFSLTVNGKTIEGQMMEKDQARRQYMEIVRKLIDPGLLEFLDERTVQVSVAPIFPGETKTIRLSYTQLLKQEGGLTKYQYLFGSSTPGMGGGEMTKHFEKAEHAQLTLKLSTTDPLKTIYSPSHSPTIDRKGNSQAEIKLNLAEASAQKSFVLFYSQDRQTVSLNSLRYKKPSEDGYFLMTVQSPLAVTQAQRLPKNVALVIDTSGSMGGEKIQQARKALTYILDHLNPEDRFNVIQFNTDVSSFKSGMVPATKETVREAVQYAEGLVAEGSTNIEAAMQTAFGQIPDDAERPDYVIFLTDGEPTVGVTDTPSLVKLAEKANRQNAKVFTFGVGYDVRTPLLNQLATGHHGSATYVEPNENLELALTTFYNKIVAPVLTDVTVSFNGVAVDRVYPSQVGDLFAGSEVILLGRFKHGVDGEVVITGRSGNKTETFRYPVHWVGDSATEHAYLPRLWAGRRIGTLLEAIAQNGENAETKNEVIQLSKQYGIVTPYTAYLAMEPDGARDPRVRRDAAPAAPLSSMDALKSSTGSANVKAYKAMGKIQQQANVKDLEEAQMAGAGGSSGLTLRTVADKTFRLDNGVWTDTAYEAKTHGAPRKVTFGSPEYFDLLSAHPDWAPYFSLGQSVLVVVNGIAYQVMPPVSS